MGKLVVLILVAMGMVCAVVSKRTVSELVAGVRPAQRQCLELGGQWNDSQFYCKR